MAAEPIVIYSHKVDPAGVAKLLRELAPGLEQLGPDDNWSRITIRGPKSLLHKASVLNFGHDRNYYAGPDWARQMNGMQGYFARFPANERTDRIMLLIQSFRFALTLFPPPEPELYIDSDDPRRRFVSAVVKHLDGVMFLPSSLRDAAGRVLYGTRDFDPQSVMPAIYKNVPGTPRSERPRSEGGALPDPDDAPPPSPQRVASRACALAAVSARALLEQEDPADPGVEETRQRILKWVEEIGIREELEPNEWQLLQHPIGVPEQRDTLNATWRLEGLGVLAWALNLQELRPIDQLVDPGQLLPAVGILDQEKAAALLSSPNLRTLDELAATQNQMFAMNWRMTDWRLRHKPMNFVEFAKTAWFGPLDLGGIRILEDDVAIGDVPLSRADRNAVGAAISAAVERHQAINWLNGGSEIYSETDVST